MPAAAVLTHNPKTTVAATLISVFLCGAIAGAVAMNLVDPHHPSRLVWISGKRPDINEWKRELNLTDVQTRQLEVILDDFSKYYDNVLADGKTRVLQLLDEDQKRKFNEMLTKNSRH